MTIKLVAGLVLLMETLAHAYSGEAPSGKIRGYALEKTVFVIEVTGAGGADARSKAMESSRIGAKRMREY